MLMRWRALTLAQPIPKPGRSWLLGVIRMLWTALLCVPKQIGHDIWLVRAEAWRDCNRHRGGDHVGRCHVAYYRMHPEARARVVLGVERLDHIPEHYE